MKTSAMLALLTVAACASGGSGNESGSPGIKTGNGSEMSYRLASPAPTTWQYLPIAYSRLGLTITRYDSTTHVIEGERQRSQADFDGKPLSSVLNCGDVAGVPNVAHDDVTIHVRTSLSGSDSSSSIANTVGAFAKPSAGSGDAIPCSVGTAISDRVAAAVTSAIEEGTK